jgi:flagellar biogenesis protein FliO
MPPTAAKSPTNKLVVAGAILVIAGFMLPRLLPSPTAPTAAATPASAPDYTGFLLKMCAGTLTFSGACYLFVRRRKPAPAVAGNMEIVATVPIASRGLVHLVRAGNHRLLLGVDLHGVKAIAELPGAVPSNIVGPLRLVPEAA